MHNKSLFFACDSANKNMHHVIKMVSFWCIDRVLTFLLDSDEVVWDNINTAGAADVSLKKVDPCTEGTTKK